MLIDHALSMLWAATWQSFVLAVAVWIIVEVSRDALRPRWRYAVWCLVFVRLAMPVIPGTPWGVLPGPTVSLRADPGETRNVGNRSPASNTAGPRGATVDAESAVVEVHPRSSGDPKSFDRDESQVPGQPRASEEPRQTRVVSPSMQPSDGTADAVEAAAISKPSVDHEAIAEEEAPAATPGWLEYMKFTLLCLWLAGVLVALAHYVMGAIHVVRMRRAWEPVEDESVRKLFAACCKRLGISKRAASRIRLFAVDGEPGGGSLGTIRPVIVVSQRALDQLSDEQLEFVLLH